MNQLTITSPDDWHLHFRDNDMLQQTVPATARCFKRAIVMPNLLPPVTNKAMAMAYRERIITATPQGTEFQPLMTLYLTNDTTVEDIRTAISPEIPAAKLYPAGPTPMPQSRVSNSYTPFLKP